MTKSKSSLEHLRWLVRSRDSNNVTAIQLLELFEKHPLLIRKRPHAIVAQDLVGVAFSLWRAAFLTETKGTILHKVGDAEEFLRKMLSDNSITFAQDIQWREWSANFYIRDARLRLRSLAKSWQDMDIEATRPEKGRGTAKERWILLHDAFEQAVSRLSQDLAEAHAKISK